VCQIRRGRLLQVVACLDGLLQDHLIVESVFEVDPKLQTTEPMGQLTPVPTLIAFVPAHGVFSANAFNMVKGQISQAASQAATPSLRKQYELQLKWFTDSTQAQAE
jgi:hypothetical protein